MSFQSTCWWRPSNHDTAPLRSHPVANILRFQRQQSKQHYRKGRMQKIPFLFHLLPTFCLLFLLSFLYMIQYFIFWWVDMKPKVLEKDEKSSRLCRAGATEYFHPSLQISCLPREDGHSVFWSGAPILGRLPVGRVSLSRLFDKYAQWQRRIKCELALGRITILFLSLPSCSTKQNRPRLPIELHTTKKRNEFSL